MLSKQTSSLLAYMFSLSYVFVCCVSMHACVLACIFMHVCAGVLVHRCECIWRPIRWEPSITFLHLIH